MKKISLFLASLAFWGSVLNPVHAQSPLSRTVAHICNEDTSHSVRIEIFEVFPEGGGSHVGNVNLLPASEYITSNRRRGVNKECFNNYLLRPNKTYQLITYYNEELHPSSYALINIGNDPDISHYVIDVNRVEIESRYYFNDGLR